MHFRSSTCSDTLELRLSDVTWGISIGRNFAWIQVTILTWAAVPVSLENALHKLGSLNLRIQ